jgi:hypothetical protein
MPTLLEEIYRLQGQLTGLDPDERHLLKMFANLLESHYEVKEPRNPAHLRGIRNDSGAMGDV